MKRAWSVKTEDGKHTVEYSRSIFGIVRVSIDENIFKLGYISCFSQKNEPFRVGDTQCILMIKRGGKAEISAADCEVEQVKANT